MIRKDFPKLGEHYFEERLPNGLLVRVMEKPGFAKRYAFVAADYGSIDAEFFLNGKKYTTPQGVAHYLEHKMFDLPEGNAMQEFAKYAGANNAFTSYNIAGNMESLAKTQWQCMCAGKMNVLTKEQIDAVLVRFQTYGQTTSKPGELKGY